jgi:hypothetical protein
MSNDDDAVVTVASGRAREIPWGDPTLARLSEAARLIYACLVDGRSEPAMATLRGVDVVWRNRHGPRRNELLHREAFDEICDGVQELLELGLVILREPTTVQSAWVRRPWAEQVN